MRRRGWKNNIRCTSDERMMAVMGGEGSRDLFPKRIGNLAGQTESGFLLISIYKDGKNRRIVALVEMKYFDS